MDRHNAYIAHRCRKARETGFFNACKKAISYLEIFYIFKLFMKK
ncbi:hypothetical protein J619_01325 [Acinetobacter sp. 478810]|nr:hypothetical protein J619_01325 [Acinetobacter sp. 478810]